MQEYRWARHPSAKAKVGSLAPLRRQDHDAAHTLHGGFAGHLGFGIGGDGMQGSMQKGLAGEVFTIALFLWAVSDKAAFSTPLC